jgi:transcriptional regulator with XRE-family HTH domain
MSTLEQLHVKWMQDPDYRADHEALETEFAIAAAIIDARAQAGLTQEQLAERMHVKQPFVARLESGSPNATLKTLQKVAKATGTHLNISFSAESAVQLSR